MALRESLASACFEEAQWAETDLLLMADEALVDQTRGAKFRICPLEKHPEPVLHLTERWEGGDGEQTLPYAQDPIDGSMLFDPHQHRFHLWYRTHNRLLRNTEDPAMGDSFQVRGLRTPGSVVCYATSTDGLLWDKPRVGALMYEGSCDNNMIDVTVGEVMTDHLSGIVPNRLPGATKRLVGTVYSHYKHPIYDRGITQLYSDNGIDWEAHFPPTIPLDGDAHNLIWDERQKCYICTTRSTAHAHEVRRMQKKGFSDLRAKRHIALAKSTDLVHWTPMLTVVEADDKDPDNTQLYRMYIVPYGHLYIGFLQMFYMSADMTYGPLDIQLAVSRDLMEWQRIGDRTPFVPRGPEGAWDGAHTSMIEGRPHLEGDRLRFWLGGKDTQHWQVGRAAMSTGTIRRDGFACYEAGPNGGTVTTVPMKMTWATMPLVNVDATDGEFRMEILDESGKPIEGCTAADCKSIIGDHIRANIEYGPGRGTFIRHTGMVRLRFHLKNAKLYAVKAPNVVLG